MSKPDCYKCKHRGTLPGNGHSRCTHPATGGTSKDPLLEIMGILGGVGRVDPLKGVDFGAAHELNIQGDKHGIANGWFIWPVNFDPAWLENCDGFEEKE